MQIIYELLIVMDLHYATIATHSKHGGCILQWCTIGKSILNRVDKDFLTYVQR